MGTLMAAPENAAYYYEPLKTLDNKWNANADDLNIKYGEFLRNLSHCNPVCYDFRV